MKIINGFALLFFILGSLIAQPAYDCGFGGIDIYEIEPLNGGLYTFDFEFHCETIGGLEFGIVHWPILAPYSADSVYARGDQVLWGQSVIDTAWYECLVNLPDQGIDPTNETYWSRIDSLVTLEMQSVVVDSSQILPLQMAARITYDKVMVNANYMFAAYRIDINGEPHLFEMDLLPLNLPFSDPSFEVSSSADSWNFDEGENIFIEGVCYSDTIQVTASVHGHFDEPVAGVELYYLSSFAETLSPNAIRTDSLGNAVWDIRFPITQIPPVYGNLCVPPDCGDCEYQYWSVQMTVISMNQIPLLTSAFDTMELLRNSGECDICPGYETGCQDVFAWNYDSLAIGDDGSCLFKGDINADLDIDILDVSMQVEMILNPGMGDDYELWAGDMNSDASLSVYDVVILIENILEMD